MSTKATISHSKDHHLYQEIFDVSNVYLRIDKSEFEVSRDTVTIQIPIKIWRKSIEDWAKSGWPESEDHTEKEIGEDWLKRVEENPIFNKRSRNEKD